jgi:hypothetical protein
MCRDQIAAGEDAEQALRLVARDDDDAPDVLLDHMVRGLP